MHIIYEPPVNLLLAALLLLLASGSAWRGARCVSYGLRAADRPSGSVWLVRGIQGAIIALAMAALGGGVLYGQAWLLIFGVIFLAEELYETGIVLLALRTDEKV
ncbi:MAG: hypothetical protein HYV46_17275 [candidate division NC10 bacterium]|nr:hypothetical protein [candidate division NC10 bacterium]MBI2457878.1 hypothetical protein [candidate division NC10 bacterium]